MNRRDFLDPRHLARTAGQVAGAVEELTSIPQIEEDQPAADDVPLLRLGWRAMATSFELVLPCGLAEPLDAGRRVFTHIDELEDQLTVYRDSSEVSRINDRAFDEPVVVEPRLFELLRLARRIHQESEGAFDITAGALVKCWGFFRGPPRLPSRRLRDLALDCVGMQHVELDLERKTIRFRKPGLELNLGSIGKGYALDRAAERLAGERPEIDSALLQGGQSSVYARGCQPNERRGWAVALRHPWEPERCLGMVYLRDRGLGTSAATHRHLEFQGRKLGHVLDPRSGWPAEGMASATALAPTAAEADALATAFFIQGVEWTLRYCAEHSEVAAFLLPAGEARPVAAGFRPGEIEWMPERPPGV